MKKLFTFLVLLSAALVSYAQPGQPEVIAQSDQNNWKIVKVNPTTYRLEAVNTGNPINFQNNPSDNDFKDPGAAQRKNELQNCTGTLYVKGDFSYVSGFNNNYFGKFETVNLSEMNYTTTGYTQQPSYQAYNSGFSYACKLANTFKGAKTLTMDPEETLFMDFFEDNSNVCNLVTLNLSTGTKRILAGMEDKRYILNINTFSTVNFNSDLEEIGNWAFYYGNYDANSQSQFTNVTFPASLKKIGGEAFHGSKISHAYLAGCTGLQTLDHECFEDCAALDSINFPANSTFTFLGNDAFKGCTSIVNVDMSMCEGIEEFQANYGNYKTFCGCLGLKTVILPPNLKAVPKDINGVLGVFNNCPAIESVTFTGTAVYNGCVLQNPCTIGEGAFAYRYNLKTITLSNNVSSIDYLAFSDAAITEIHIPASVQTIAQHSFNHCENLTTVYFDEFDGCDDCNCKGAETEIAGHEGSGGQGFGGFEDSHHITDVYINTKAKLKCINNAFDQDITWGAGNVEANFATLHFPKENTSHYVNLKHYLTDEIVADPGLFHQWLHDHYDRAINPEKNGWYEFINAGPTDPNAPECQSIILRTFSDYELSYLVPNGIRAYVVNGIGPKKIKNGENEVIVPDVYEVTLQRIRVIPAKTGVILYGHPNGKKENGAPTLVMTPVKFAGPGESVTVGNTTFAGSATEGLPLCRANWDDNYVKNYLEPILSANGNPVQIKPYETVKVNGVDKVSFRNFGLGRYTNTDYYAKNTASLTEEEYNYVGFFRMKPQSYKSGYAYLRLAGDVDENGNELTNSEFPVAEGGEILVKPDTDKDEDNGIYPYYYEFKLTDGKPFDATKCIGVKPNEKGWWNPNATPNAFKWDEYQLSWGDRTLGFSLNAVAKYFGELEEDADGIIKIEIPANNTQGDYYTLQGVRVANPTKGIYIQNGKKVIVK